MPTTADECVREWEPLAKRLAGWFARLWGAPYPDVYADALLGLWRAWRTFDAGHGVAMKTWAGYCVRKQCLDGERVRRGGRGKCRPRHTASLSDLVHDEEGRVLRLGDVVPDPEAEDPSAPLQTDDAVNYLLRALQPAERYILRRCDAGPVSQEEAARRLGLHPSAVSVRRTGALRYLAGMLNRDRVSEAV